MRTRGVVASWSALLLLIALATSGPAYADHSIFERVSTGPAGGNGAFPVTSQGLISRDGHCVVFETAEPLTPDDTDTSSDIYKRCGSTTERVSRGNTDASGNGASSLSYDGMSSSGDCVLFSTDEALTPDDTDTTWDAYKRCGQSTERVSRGDDSASGNDGGFSVPHAISADGSCVTFESADQLVATDTDSNFDIYKRCGSTTEIIPQGSATSGNANGVYLTQTPDLNCVVFQTLQPLVSEDTDTDPDIYKRCGSTTSLVSTGPNSTSGSGFSIFGSGAGTAISDDGSCVAFQTNEPLTSDDTDTSQDVYRRCGTTTERMSRGDDPTSGNGVSSVFIEDMSADGACVVFLTTEKLTSDDTDTSDDLYERCGSTTDHVTIGPAGGNGPSPNLNYDGMSSDGSRVFFDTDESLTADDTDGGGEDVYERFGGVTTRISTGPLGGNATGVSAAFDDVSADGTAVLFDTPEALTSDDTDSEIDLYAARVAPPPPNVNGNGSGSGSGGSANGTPAPSPGGNILPPAIPRDTTPPLLAALKLTPRSFRAARSGPSVAAATGATVTFTLSEPATTTFAVLRAVPGVKRGHGCVKPSRRSHRGRRCTRFVSLPGSFTRVGTAGSNRFRFTGRLGGRTLRAGAYELVATPRDGAGNVGRRAGVQFRVVR